MAANQLWVTIVTAVAVASVLALAFANGETDGAKPDRRRSERPASPAFEVVTLALREDYEKGDDLDDVAKDFVLMNELGVYEVQFNINWDTYGPERGRYDFEWLHEFVGLAAKHNIRLRPYICYSPGWAAEAWNAPPRDMADWREFCLALGKAMSRHPNILSYEIWMEQNSDMWWIGTIEEYRSLFEQAAAALRSTDPDCQVFFGGLTFPNHQWLDVFANGATDCGDAILLHCFHESWGPPGVPVEDSLDSLYTDLFLPVVDSRVPDRPVWMSECGYSTWNRSEEDQASFIARAVPHFLANNAGGHRITRFTYYETKDLPEGSPMIGDDHNYHFGLCRADRTKKLGFHTYALLAKLLNGKAIAPASEDVTVTATDASFGQLYHHLLKRADGVQLLFLYDKESNVNASATLADSGSSCTRWDLDGTSQPWPDFDGKTVSNIALEPGAVWILQIE